MMENWGKHFGLSLERCGLRANGNYYTRSGVMPNAMMALDLATRINGRIVEDTRIVMPNRFYMVVSVDGEYVAGDDKFSYRVKVLPLVEIPAADPRFPWRRVYGEPLPAWRIAFLKIHEVPNEYRPPAGLV